MNWVRRLRITIALVPLALACSASNSARVTDAAVDAETVCRWSIVTQPVIQLAAERAGKPLDVYVAEACKTVGVIAPAVRAANELSVCQLPTAGAAGAMATAGAAGAQP